MKLSPLHDEIKIYACTGATVVRKGINGLSAIVREQREIDPMDGSLFDFLNQSRD